MFPWQFFNRLVPGLFERGGTSEDPDDDHGPITLVGSSRVLGIGRDEDDVARSDVEYIGAHSVPAATGHDDDDFLGIGVKVVLVSLPGSVNRLPDHDPLGPLQIFGDQGADVEVAERGS